MQLFSGSTDIDVSPIPHLFSQKPRLWQDSGKTVHMRSLIWAFAACLHNKYQNFMYWLKLFIICGEVYLEQQDEKALETTCTPSNGSSANSA